MALLPKSLQICNIFFSKSRYSLMKAFNYKTVLQFDKESLFRRCMATSTTIANIDINELKSFINDPDATLVDVREVNEIQETGKLPRSINIPLGDVSSALKDSDDKFKIKYKAAKPSFDDIVVFSCRSGKRSLKAAETATNIGYKKVYNYAGGWLDWEKYLPKN